MKKFDVFVKRLGLNKSIFQGLGISFAVMVGTMGIFAFLFLSAVALRDWLEGYVSQGVVFNPPAQQARLPQGTPVPPPSTGSTNPLFDLFRHRVETPIIDFSVVPSAQAPASELKYDVLYDLFSGTGWIDQGKTTMYQDMLMTAFMLPPQFTFEKESFVSSANFIERNADGSDDRCIAHKCLTQKGNTLLFDGRSLKLPAEVQQGAVVSVSIGSLSTGWPVGIVTKNGEDYSGWLFLFDGNSFRNIQREGREVFVSRYGGSIGFGGTDSDWMAVYGAYEGKGVRVKNGVIDDISRFFGIRVMAGGFDPEITRTEADNDTTWYVWNKAGMPKLIKLFENGTGSIAGATDLSVKLSAIAPGVSAMRFAPSTTPHVLEAKAFDGGVEYWKFADQGFDNGSTREIVSASLTNRILPVKIAVIPQVELSDAGNAVDFYLSNDGQDWSKVNIGDKVTFANQNGDKTFWRAVVHAPSNRYQSPYFGMIEINYAFQQAN